VQVIDSSWLCRLCIEHHNTICCLFIVIYDIVLILAEHRPPRGVKRPDPHPEEAQILKAVPEIAAYITALKQHSRKLVVLALRQLLRMVREYPREPLLAAVAEAARYGLYDLDRVERMILRQVARDYFLLNNNPETE